MLMSRNISGGPVVDVFMGGLNHQVEHHLYPSMPRPHLRKAQPLVAAYCVAQQSRIRNDTVAVLRHHHPVSQHRRPAAP